MPKLVRGVLQYDGTGYRGWQRQPDAPTVQEACERALGNVLGEPVGVVAAGRTDTGVHACGQVIHFEHRSRLAPSELRRAWNAHLPQDIWVERLEPAPPGFHARYDARRRTYRYYVADGPQSRSPFVRRYAWPQVRPLDWERIESGTRRFLGRHDFRGFAKGDGRAANGEDRGMCTIMEARWDPTEEGRVLKITADRFLRHMVRAIVAALVAVGRGQVAGEALGAALEAGPRVRAGAAPPNGLFLWKVEYE